MGDWMDEWGQYGPQGERKERLDALRARLDARPRPDAEPEGEGEGPRQDEREEDREDEPTERIPVEPAGEAESTAPLDLEAVAEAGGTEDATAGPSHRRALRAAAIVLAVLAAGGVGAAAVSGVQASQIRGLQASCQDARHAQGQAFDRLGEATLGMQPVPNRQARTALLVGEVLQLRRPFRYGLLPSSGRRRGWTGGCGWRGLRPRPGTGWKPRNRSCKP